MRSALADLEPLFGEDALALVTLRHGRAHVRLAAAELTAIDEIEAWLSRTLPVVEPTECQELPVRFWSRGPHGAGSVTRTIDVPSFAAIEPNYPREVRDALAALSRADFALARSGQLTDYMVDVLLGDESRFELDDLHRDEPPRWQLMVLEDTGELLATDAKERTGQGLSRLLNLVDGIVGQGLRVLVPAA